MYIYIYIYVLTFRELLVTLVTFRTPFSPRILKFKHRCLCLVRSAQRILSVYIYVCMYMYICLGRSEERILNTYIYIYIYIYIYLCAYVCVY